MKQQLQNDSLVVTFDGDVLSTNVDTLRDEFARIMGPETGKAAPWKVLELDLRKTKMMDSAGLNLIMTVLKAAKARGARVVAKIASKTVHRIFLFTRLDKHLELILQEGAA